MKLRSLLGIDFLLLFSAVFITIFGILFIYSSGVDSTGNQISREYLRQIIWGAAGLIIALALALMNYRRIYHFVFYIYLGSIVLLVYTFLAGHEISGSRSWLGVSRWIGFASFGIQPSEFTKITTILFLAQYLDITRHNEDDLKRFIVAAIIVFVPMLLVLIQPDFGTSLVFIPIFLVMLFIAGIGMRFIVFILVSFALAAILIIVPYWQKYALKLSVPGLALLSDIRFVGILTFVLALIFGIALFGFIRYKKQYFYWIDYCTMILAAALCVSFAAGKMFKPYQINRLVVFIDPFVDPQGAGWHIIQSMTAVGSGGALGKGYMQGTQSHYRFLPTQSTDFIFSIFSEEWGFLGGILLFLLFLTICLRLIRIMKTTADPFGCYIVAGLSAMYVFHFLENVGMAMGIMPITGIPLFFMSYGGSALISAMAGIGLALSVHLRRFQY